LEIAFLSRSAAVGAEAVCARAPPKPIKTTDADSIKAVESLIEISPGIRPSSAGRGRNLAIPTRMFKGRFDVHCDKSAARCKRRSHRSKCYAHDSQMHAIERDPVRAARFRPPALTVIVRARLLLPLRGVGLVAPDEAAGGSAQQAVVDGIMAGDSADQRTLDATLSFGHRGRQQHGDCKSHSSADLSHGGTPDVYATMKMSRYCSPGSTGRRDLTPGVSGGAPLDRSNLEFQMLAEPQDLYGDAVVDAPAVEEANEVVDPRDLVVAQTDDDVLGFESCGGRRTVRLDSRHQHA
jgi:hypothetical protein